MNWVKFSPELYVGGRFVPVRSLLCSDETGNRRRYRVCTLWNPGKNVFTRQPGQARLVRDKHGKVGVVITGRSSGFVKVGKDSTVQQSIVASIDAISKKAGKKLLGQINVELVEHDGIMVEVENELKTVNSEP